jgi:hypothetical protein
MKFQICFNNYYNDKLLVDKLGAYYIPTGSDKYPPFEVLEIEVEDFDKLKDILDIIDGELMINIFGKTNIFKSREIIKLMKY